MRQPLIHVGEHGSYAIYPQPEGRGKKRLNFILNFLMFDDLIFYLAGLICALVLGGCAPSPSEVYATDAWMRAVPAGAVGAVYLEVHNPTDESRRLVEARFEEAVATEMHETVQEGDIMRMLPMEDGLTLAAGESASFEPGGKHIMVMDLHRDMEIGATETLTLIFDDATELEVPVEVRDPLDLGD
jgi:copper(I)-binding protein